MKQSATRATVAIVSIGLLFVPGKAAQCAFMTLAFTLAVSFAWSRAIMRGLSVKRGVLALKASCQDREKISLFVENRSFLPALECRVTDAAGLLSVSADDGRWALSLAGGERALLSYEIRCNERGAFSVGPVRVRASDPIGLFPFEKTIETRCAVLVRPRIARLGNIPGSGVPQGAILVRDARYEDITLFKSVREYAAGDEMRRINWKASARLGRLLTNAFQDSLNSPFVVFLNLSAGDYALQGRHEEAETLIARAAALVARARELGQRCAFFSSGFVARESGPKAADGALSAMIETGFAEPEAVLDLLARISLADRDAAETDAIAERATRKAVKGTRLFIVSPAMPKSLEARGVRLTHVAECAYEARL